MLKTQTSPIHSNNASIHHYQQPSIDQNMSGQFDKVKPSNPIFGASPTTTFRDESITFKTDLNSSLPKADQPQKTEISKGGFGEFDAGFGDIKSTSGFDDMKSPGTGFGDVKGTEAGFGNFDAGNWVEFDNPFHGNDKKEGPTQTTKPSGNFGDFGDFGF